MLGTPKAGKEAYRKKKKVQGNVDETIGGNKEIGIRKKKVL